MKTAILQCADTGPLESLVVMLRSVGYQCWSLDDKLKSKLRHIGCDTVLDIENLVRGMGYEQPIKLPLANTEMMDKCDLYVDIKAHRNGPKIWERWPRLRDKTLWYRINGGQPEHVINKNGDHGDEVNPPCPVLTPNQWYKKPSLPNEELVLPQSTYEKSYACWPPFYRFSDYYDKNSRVNDHRKVSIVISSRESYTPPVCLIHGINGWGYHSLVETIRELGVKCYGVAAPDGLLNHSVIPKLLSTSLCMVHLKSNDAPGYSLYESLSAGCPIILTRRMIWRCRMQELFIPDETCLVFDRETHEGLSEQDILECTTEVKDHLERLKDPIENRRIGMNGYNKLKELMWSQDSNTDVDSLKQFMSKNFEV